MYCREKKKKIPKYIWMFECIKYCQRYKALWKTNRNEITTTKTEFQTTQAKPFSPIAIITIIIVMYSDIICKRFMLF